MNGMPQIYLSILVWMDIWETTVFCFTKHPAVKFLACMYAHPLVWVLQDTWPGLKLPGNFPYGKIFVFSLWKEKPRCQDSVCENPATA